MSFLAVAPTIPEFFAGRTVLVTGGTGFLGKVLVEKLLRSCPDVAAIYLLIREKKGRSAEERLAELADLPLYDRLKEERPGALAKVKAVYGDVMQLNLGLSPEDEALLAEEVSVFYHAAASVRFDDSLKDAILMNTRGTREAVRLALKMKRLQAFLHVSTTYCNTDRKEIEERLYEPHADWRASIAIAEEVDGADLDVLTAKYMGSLPNTYTFTKSMAEHVVDDLCRGKVPAVVFRPSIVISTVKEPFSGWIDNFNGPVGMFVASGKGILRSMYTDPDIVSDYMPVDIAIKALIIASWLKATEKSFEQKLNDIPFYNCSSHGVRAVTMGHLVELGKQLTWEVPLNNQLWYPSGAITKCKPLHYVKVLFLHLLPAIVVDLVLRATNKKPMLVKLQRRIYTANTALEYFVTNQWSFFNARCLGLEHRLLEPDRELFSFDVDEFDVYTYFRNAMIGGRRYLLKEDDSTIERARKMSKRMWLLAQATDIAFYVLAFWLLFCKINIVRLMADKCDGLYQQAFD